MNRPVRAAIKAIEYYLPETILDNVQLAKEFPEWTAEKILNKTGISKRHIVNEQQTSADLAEIAGKQLFASGICQPEEIDFVLLCTQSPDYFLPTTACILQNRLEIPTTVGAMDFNLGCSGFVYGLSLAKGLIETGQVRNALLITAETYSKFIHPQDKSVRTIFGDAAAVTLIQAVENDGIDQLIGPFVFGTDGAGANNLIVPTGGLRQAYDPNASLETDGYGNQRTRNNLFMDGPEIFNFTIRVVPNLVRELLDRSSLGLSDVDHFVFHQANKYMLEYLRRKLKLPVDKFHLTLEDSGNTVSATIPIALKKLSNQGALLPGQLVMVVGFGVGYSWGATLIRWGA